MGRSTQPRGSRRTVLLDQASHETLVQLLDALHNLHQAQDADPGLKAVWKIWPGVREFDIERDRVLGRVYGM